VASISSGSDERGQGETDDRRIQPGGFLATENKSFYHSSKIAWGHASSPAPGGQGQMRVAAPRKIAENLPTSGADREMEGFSTVTNRNDQ
jgi:hypothetical protein